VKPLLWEKNSQNIRRLKSPVINQMMSVNVSVCSNTCPYPFADLVRGKTNTGDNRRLDSNHTGET
jgi:hypothetical protein